VTDRVALLTLTAPGNDVHVNKWTDQPCRCTPPGGVDLPWWNATKSKRWNRFLRDLRRLMGPHDDVQYGRGVEAQRRGALHDHVLVRCRGDLVALKEAVRQLAMDHGFGHEVDLRWARPGDEWYLAKYVSVTCDQVDQVEWRDLDTGFVTIGARCRTWTTSRRWGLTMKELKRQQREWTLQEQDAERRRTGPSGPDAGAPAVHVQRPADVWALDPSTGSYAKPDADGWSPLM
jgi:hypothetical protein